MKYKNISVFFTILILLINLFIPTVSANSTEGGKVQQSKTRSDRLPFYSELLSEYDYVIGKDTVNLNYTDAVFKTENRSFSDELNGKNANVIISNEDNEDISWNFSVSTAGLYSVSVDYLNLNKSGNNSVRGLEIDGESPFFETSNIVFRSKWVDDGEVMINSMGDEVRPEVRTVDEWQTMYLTDSDANISLPFAFWFDSGAHTITLKYVSNDMAIDSIGIMPYTVPPSYSEVSSGYSEKSEGTGIFTFQAEDAMAFRNDSTVGMTSGTDAEMVPVSDGYRIYNMVGNDTWSDGNQSVTFEFDVPEDGLYKIAMRYRQKWNDGLPSFRKVEIDGKVPFSELLSYKFVYSTKWETEIFSDGNDPYLFELSEGKHTITLTVVQGEFSEIVHSLYDITSYLSDMMLDITMLTGNDPDPNYDYQFFKFIPTLEGDFKFIISEINSILDDLSKITDKSTSISSSLKSTAKQFESMVENPFSIARRYSQLSNAQTTLGNWYSTLQSLPLALDEFCIAQPNAEIEVRQSNIFQNIVSAFKGFLVTFTRDYNGVGTILSNDIEIKETISVWIGQGNEWAEILKEMTDRDFTAETGISVDLSVVPQGQINSGSANVLLLSVISGSAPDAVFSVASGTPVEFAIRDAAVDLSAFEDFDDVREQFLDNSFVPLEYNGGTYAVPETMTFTSIFYRKDILDKYGIKVPQTWDELCGDTLQVLAQNGMQFYLPQNFSIFLFQNGGKYYTDDGIYSALDTPVAFFEYIHYFFIFFNYGCPVSASFFNRFRSGEMPIGIGDFSFYLQVKNAAPELADKWEMAPMIGTVQKDGQINRSAGAALSQCSMILSKEGNEKYEACWEYLKWWISAETQSEYARSVEALLGAESRWCSANLEAFMSLDWSRNDRKVFEEQWKWVEETPVVLGSAYASRYLTNAFTDTVVSGTASPRDALETAVIEINKELKYKQEEYGVFADE